MSLRNQPRLLYIILLGYLVIAVMTSVITPIFEVYDEVWHYPLVEHLANHGLQLPRQDPGTVTQWRQQGSQPPLYYLAVAVLTAAIDTSDLDTVHRENPLPQAGFAVPDGNPNVIVHHADLEAFPWKGTALAVHVARFFSILLGFCTVLVTYHLAREVFPGQPTISLGATALHAFLPMFILMSAAVTNDALSNLLASLLLLLVVRLLKAQHAPNWRRYAAIGVVTGAGLLSKLSFGLYIPIVVFALAVISLRLRDWRPLVIGGLISGGLTGIIAGWWYYRNWNLYGDPTGLNIFLDIVGRRDPEANLTQIWSERFSILKTYWGAYGSINVLLPETVYTVFHLIGVVALVGAGAYAANALVRHRPIRQTVLIAAIIVIWPLIALLGLIRWTMQTPGSQGRLLFVALSALSLWMAVGLTWWLPRKYKPVPVTAVAGFFVAVAFLAPLLIVRPAFAPPPNITPDQPVTMFANTNGEGRIALSSPHLLTPSAQPGDFVDIEVTWQIIEPTADDWTLYAHLITPEGVIAGQRDVYPGRGLLATSNLPAGRAWENPLSVLIPSTAYAPRTVTVVVGWYRLDTGERMVLPNGDTTFPVGQVELIPSESDLDVPNPVRVNFGNRVELVGYVMSTLSPHAGETLEVTLYWRGLRQMEEDYVVFVHVIDMDTLAKYAASNAMPAAWTAPTSSWEPGVIIEDTHVLPVDPGAPADIFEVEIGLFVLDEAQAYPRLRIVPDEGERAENYLRLSNVRILPADEGE